MDIWLYPEQLDDEPLVVNIFECQGSIECNIYSLPDNWKDIVTQNKGEDGKPSIHDIMIPAN